MSREISNQPQNGATCGCHKTRAAANTDTLQRILDAPGSIARRWSQSNTISGIEVLAGPGQQLSSQPLPGDILIRIVDGGSGHAALVTSSGLFHPEDLADHGMSADTESADGFVQVSERNESPRTSSVRYARGVTDHSGRLLDDLLLLRLASPPPAVVQPNTVVTVGQPSATAPALPATVDDDASTEPAVSEDTGVIGTDDRVRITPTTDTPWRWICHIALEDGRQRSEGHGSGILISDRHVLTAAHVVYDVARDRQLHFARVSPGLDYDNSPFGTWSVSQVRVCPKYDPSDDKNQEWDYALVTLDKAVGQMKFAGTQNQPLRFWGAAEFGGRFTMGPGEPRNLIATDAFTAGYRGSKGYGTQQWFAKGNIRQVSPSRWPNSLFTTVVTTEGDSGSPLWVKEGDTFRMVGVVVDAGRTVNVVRRITPGMVAELRKWIADDHETPWMPAPGETESVFVEDAESWGLKEDEVSCDHIDASQLSWPGATAQQLDLMRRVYLRQVTAACQSRTFVPDLADSELAEIEGGERLRTAAAANCRALLGAARAAAATDPAAAAVTAIEVVSGYRSARRQLDNWNRNFPRYYDQTQSDRAAAAGGEFGDAAAALLTRYISGRLAAPGFSLHNDGRAVDFRTTQSGTSMSVDSSARNRSNWRAGWFFHWLSATAAGYGFFQNTSIDEPWHWESRGAAAPTQSIATGFAPDTVELWQPGESFAPAELTISRGRIESSNTALLAAHRGTQPDLILRWNDMSDPATVDVVLHFHGYSSDRERMSLRNKEAYSGLDFSNPNNLNDATPGRTAPTLGILPRGSYTGDGPGVNPERYTFPALNTPARVNALVGYSLGQFQSATGSNSVAPGRFILTAHSGGGAALMQLLRNNDSDEIRIDEIQIFDALYGPASTDAVSPLLSWINRRIAAEIQSWTTGKTRSGSALCIVHRSGTEGQSQIVATALRTAIASAPADAQSVLGAAYRVHRTAVAHGQIPRQFGWRLLADHAQAFSMNSGLAESDIAEQTPVTQTPKPVQPARMGGPQLARTTAAPPGSTAFPLDVSLSAEVRLYEATEQWVPAGSPQRFAFKPTRLPAGEWSTPPLQVRLNAGHRWLLEIWVSIGSASQTFFWRCDARSAAAIKRLDPLGPQPDAVPGSPVVPSPGGDSPVLAALTANQAFAGTQGFIQVSGQISGAASAIQGQLGINLPVVPQVAGQRTTPSPQYSVTFTADLILANLPPALTIPDHYVQFANDSATISSAETTSLLDWVQRDLGKYPRLRDAIRAGQVPVLLTGKASLRGHARAADHNLTLSQRRLEAVRSVLQGGASASGGGRTQGGVLGSENVKIDAEADGDFHDTAPPSIDQDRVVQISIDSAAASLVVRDAAIAPPSEGDAESFFPESLGDAPANLAALLDQSAAQTSTLRNSLSAVDNPSRVSRLRIAAETRLSVDANPYAGLGRGQLECVLRAAVNAVQAPETLLALWAKEGSLRMATSATPVAGATTADNARALFRSNVYYVDLGSDHFVITRYDPDAKDNVWDSRDSVAPQHEKHFQARVGELFAAGLLTEDISAAINAELTVSSSAPFSVTPSIRFYSLSLLLMDAFFTSLQRKTFPQLASLSEVLNYVHWNIGSLKFGAFLTSAEKHRQEARYRLPSGDPPSLEQWALHTAPAAKEWRQARTNAIRFLHYRDSYAPIFRTSP